MLTKSGGRRRTAEQRKPRSGSRRCQQGAAAVSWEIDDLMRTSVPHIYAIGDLTGKLNLNPWPAQ